MWRERAKEYGLKFESIELNLGREASEERAREARWQFLREVKDKYKADKIVTAHHADDVVETMIINLMRGTGWRGIASLRETDEIKRPLLATRKAEIITYAQEHGLSWCEDATNQDDKYLRNRIRHEVVPLFSEQQFSEFMELYRKQCEIREGVEREVNVLSPALRRYEYIMWPDNVASEMLRARGYINSSRAWPGLTIYAHWAQSKTIITEQWQSSQARRKTVHCLRGPRLISW